MSSENSQNHESYVLSSWPRLFSLDQMKIEKEKQIEKIIEDKKNEFLIKNAGLDYQMLSIFLDPSRDIYYPPKHNQPSLCRGGILYSTPDEVVGIGLQIHPSFKQSQWGVLYQPITPYKLIEVLLEGFEQDLWGSQNQKKVFSFWFNQSFLDTNPENPIVLEYFVQQTKSIPEVKGYARTNICRISRILVPIKKDRSNLYK